MVINVCIVGLGHAAKIHAEGYKKNKFTNLVGVCDINNSNSIEFKNNYEVNKIYNSFNEVINDNEINLIDICTPTYLHAEYSEKSVIAGKHVHCEKPFCINIQEGEKAAKNANINNNIFVGETYVYLSSHVKAKELIDENEIGKPLQIRERHGSWLEKKKTIDGKLAKKRDWRIDPKYAGGSEFPWIFDHSVHFFSAAEFFMNNTPIYEIYAIKSDNTKIQNQIGASHDPYGMSKYDIPIITWKYEDHACQGIWTRAERLNGKFDYMNGFSTTIIGEKGLIEVQGEGSNSLKLNNKHYDLILHRKNKKPVGFKFDEIEDSVWKSDISYYGQGHFNQINHIVDCIINKNEPKYSVIQGIRSVKCALTAIKSAELNKPIKVKG